MGTFGVWGLSFRVEGGDFSIFPSSRALHASGGFMIVYVTKLVQGSFGGGC